MTGVAVVSCSGTSSGHEKRHNDKSLTQALDPNLAVDLVTVMHVVNLGALQLPKAEVFVIPDKAVVLAHVFFRLQPYLCHRKISQRGENLMRRFRGQSQPTRNGPENEANKDQPSWTRGKMGGTQKV